MSFIEEECRAYNLQAAEDRKKAEAEHLVEKNRQQITAESYNDPRLLTFKQRRREQTLQVRQWKLGSNPALPKKRVFAGLTSGS